MILYSANHVKGIYYLYTNMDVFLSKQDEVDYKLKIISIKTLSKDQIKELLEDKWVRLDEK